MLMPRGANVDTEQACYQNDAFKGLLFKKEKNWNEKTLELKIVNFCSLFTLFLSVWSSKRFRWNVGMYFGEQTHHTAKPTKYDLVQ
eukprot:4448675-Amphidinium_carterae.1